MPLAYGSAINTEEILDNLLRKSIMAEPLNTYHLIY